jgi:hypothetical protein
MKYSTNSASMPSGPVLKHARAERCYKAPTARILAPAQKTK